MIDLLLDGVRCIFALIDQMIAFVIGYLYQLIIAIADTNVFGDLIYQYLGRIYTFLGIFMVFKLSISMINYIINPDALTDKSKGFGKLISNVVISLILLVVTPTLFDVAFDIQTDLLTTNAVYQIVTGKKLENNANGSLYDNAKQTGNDIAFGVFSAFVYEDDNDQGLPICDPDDVEDGCDEKAFDSAADEDTDEDDYRCKDLGKGGDVDCLLDTWTVTEDENTYWFLLSSAVGLVVAYILLTFCFDIALRSVRLGFLQIIAPIPIMLRMDPGAKDDKFSKWLKDVGGTFASLFIRLAGLFFVTEIIRLVMNQPQREALGMLSTYSEYEQPGLLAKFATLFIIIGCLMFAKKLPQIISDLFGIKLDGGGFSLKKKMGDIPGMGAAKMLGAGALGFAGGMAANTIGAGKTWKATEGNWLKKLGATGGSIFAGGTSAMARGMTSKDKNMFKAASSGIKGAVDKRELRDKRQAAGYTLTDRIGDSIKSFGGVDGVAKQRSDETYARITNLQRQQAQYDRIAEEIALKNNFSSQQLDFYNSAKLNNNTGKYDFELKDAAGKVIRKESHTMAELQAINPDLGVYVDSIVKSNDASVKIAKENKNLKLYQKEDKSKG